MLYSIVRCNCTENNLKKMEYRLPTFMKIKRFLIDFISPKLKANFWAN